MSEVVVDRSVIKCFNRLLMFIAIMLCVSCPYSFDVHNFMITLYICEIWQQQ